MPPCQPAHAGILVTVYAKGYLFRPPRKHLILQRCVDDYPVEGAAVGCLVAESRWKLSMVVPIPKSTNMSEPSNYRPISLLMYTW